MLGCGFRSGRQGDRMPSMDVNPRALAWRKSSSSINAGACIQVAALAGGVAVRDSTVNAGYFIHFPDAAWRAFVATLRA
jgi:Domain of unknown function (DUF397)